MGVIKLPTIDKYISHEDFVELVAKVLKEFTWLLDRNISNGNIRAKTIKAEKMDVDQLSAISANLGTILAGTITTNTTIDVGTDARIGNVLYLNETDGVSDKGIVFNTLAGSETAIDVQSGDLDIRAFGGNITLNAGGDVYANGGKVATQGISVIVTVMGADGVTPVNLTFTRGVLTSVS